MDQNYRKNDSVLITNSFIYLENVLFRLSDIEESQLHKLTDFLASQMNQIKCAVESIALLESIVERKKISRKSAESLFNALQKANMSLILSESRTKLYKIFLNLCKGMEKDKNIIPAFVSLMEGENNPRSLLTVFECFLWIIEHFDSFLVCQFKDKIFDSLSMYFPLSYDGNFQREDQLKRRLTTSLRECLLNKKFVHLTFPLVLEKLEYAPDSDVKRECALIIENLIQTNLFVEIEGYLSNSISLLKRLLLEEKADQSLQGILLACLKKAFRKMFGKASALCFNKAPPKTFQATQMVDEYVLFFTELMERPRIKTEQKIRLSKMGEILVKMAESSLEGFRLCLEKIWKMASEAFYSKEPNFSVMALILELVLRLFVVLDNSTGLKERRIQLEEFVSMSILESAQNLFSSGLIGASPDIRSISIASLTLVTITLAKYRKPNKGEMLVERCADLVKNDSAVNVRLQASKSLKKIALSADLEINLRGLLDKIVFDVLCPALESLFELDESKIINTICHDVTKTESKEIIGKTLLRLGSKTRYFEAITLHLTKLINKYKNEILYSASPPHIEFVAFYANILKKILIKAKRPHQNITPLHTNFVALTESLCEAKANDSLLNFNHFIADYSAILEILFSPLTERSANILSNNKSITPILLFSKALKNKNAHFPTAFFRKILVEITTLFIEKNEMAYKDCLLDLVCHLIAKWSMTREVDLELFVRTFCIDPLKLILIKRDEVNEIISVEFCVATLCGLLIADNSMWAELLKLLIKFISAILCDKTEREIEKLCGIATRLNRTDYLSKDEKKERGKVLIKLVVEETTLREKEFAGRIAAKRRLLICLSFIVTSFDLKEHSAAALRQFQSLHKATADGLVKTCKKGTPACVYEAFVRLIAHSLEGMEADAKSLLEIAGAMVGDEAIETRLNSVECLRVLSGLKGMAGMSERVLGYLDALVDDEKRMVRRRAAYCRNVWARLAG